MEKEKISLIVPVYNVEGFLKRCINSILAQTYENFELILINDGSDDESGNICDEYSYKDKRIQVIHQENGGVSVARNAGLDWIFANSNSQWITFIDSDDWILPTYLETLYSVAKKNNVLISASNYLKVRDENVVDMDVGTVCNYSPEKFYCRLGINATVIWGKLYARDLFVNTRFLVGKSHEDEFITYKLLFSTEKIEFIEKPLYMYYINEDSLMHSIWKIERLDVIGAVEERLYYFRNNGYKRAYMKTVRVYLRLLDSAVNNIKKYYPERIDLIEKYEKLSQNIKKDLGLMIRMFFHYGMFLNDALYRRKLSKKTEIMKLL